MNLRTIALGLLFVSSAYGGFEDDYKKIYDGYSGPPDVRVEVHSSSGSVAVFDAHSTCLQQSGYFEAVLANQNNDHMPHFRDTRGKLFPLEDMEPEVFRRVLYFLYQKKIALDPEIDVVELYQAQDRLLISGMKEMIVSELESPSYLSAFSVSQLGSLLIRAKSYLPIYKVVLDYIYQHKEEDPLAYEKLKHSVRKNSQVKKDLNEVLARTNFSSLGKRANELRVNKDLAAQEDERRKMQAEVDRIRKSIAKKIRHRKAPPYKFTPHLSISEMVFGTSNQEVLNVLSALNKDPEFSDGFTASTDYHGYEIVVLPKVKR
jgi:hypothetical protein